MPRWLPRHRRERPAPTVYTLLVAAGILVVGAVWAVSVMIASDGSSPTAHRDADSGENATTPGGTRPGGDAPYHLRIPRFGVHAPMVESVSDDNRVLTPPDDPLVAGWWGQGAAPGDDVGAVLVVGHAGEPEDAVFTAVPSMSDGDLIMVTGSASLTYRVTEVFELTSGELAERADELFDQDGPPRLVVITSGGWDDDGDEISVVLLADPI
ncbi:class F sortase [Phytoactinopolyspora mesophila]|uniref:Sortase n=1 Tax=Phytoactinopolyspora mesophila TaxID=2650750 RepID=A0A7K3M0H2_9ACTN|nr:class F sortase [Phytoactinopolyspora mesophila]NDL56795.1 sortase [Phytoactinopolyspora mesophila]